MLVLDEKLILYTAISIKVVPEQSGKVEYERERLAENREKIISKAESRIRTRKACWESLKNN